ncbi:unnamed protein product [Penicillium bialowiezense]
MQTDSEPEELLPSALDGLEADRAAAVAARTAFYPGDLLKAGRYRLFRKIGQGQFAHVWLAEDMQESQNRYVAIKISLRWYTESQIREAAIIKILGDDPISDHPGRTNVIELLDEFIHSGPNSDHHCIVSKPMGRSVERTLTEFIWDDPVPYSFCRRISIQALQALDYLHQKDIMHGDIHTGNFLLALTYNIDENSEADIEAKNTHGNELNDPGDPFILDDKVDVLSGGLDAKVILVDLGASSSPKDSPSFDKADIWALGCALWRIVTGAPLFAPEGWGDMDDTNVEQIGNFVERLGPVPESLRSAWKDSDDHLTSDGHLKNPFPEDERELPLTEEIKDRKPEGMSEDEATAFVEFLSLIFRLEPSERSSTQELLQHRWVTAEWDNK